jgi:DNA-directed RNA polymerase subunit RPC12/RpoP
MNFILLNSYASYIDAHIAKGVLEEHEIECWLKDENTVTIDPILTNAVGGIKLMVAKEQAQQAWEILEKIRREHKANIACPKCSSHNVELVSTPRKPINWLSSLLTFFTGDYAVAIDKVNHCFDCGHEFPAEDKPENVG